MKDCHDYIVNRIAQGENTPRIPQNMELNQKWNWGYKYHYGSDRWLPIHRHEKYCDLFLTLTDDVVHVFGGKEQLLPKNTLVFVRPNDAHRRYSIGRENKRKWLNFVLDIAIVEQVLTYFGHAGMDIDAVINGPTPITKQLTELQARELVLDFEKYCTNPGMREENIILHLYVWLADVFGHLLLRAEDGTGGELPPVWLERAYDKMKLYENFVEGLPRMVELSGRSQEHLARSMKKYYGITATQYINELRLSYAAKRLRSTDGEEYLLDLIFDCGFQSVGYFYKLFTKKYGISPNEYRRGK